ncbi:MAG: hypothetical protein Q8L55_05300 [Phycisphaerales bacterium]|nr:hypothetical protein [Phycisphaerales bacterium]
MTRIVGAPGREWVKAYIDALVKSVRDDTASSATYSRGVALATSVVRVEATPRMERRWAVAPR